MLTRLLIAVFGFTLVGVLTGNGGVPPAEAGVACSHSAVTEWPVSAGGNGHFYRVVCAFDDEITWDDAQASAGGQGGNLASITSEAENDFIFGMLGSRGYWDLDPGDGDCLGPWLGAFEPGDDAEPDGGWEWATGEPFEYNNWAPGEPNNFLGEDENRAFYFNPDCDSGFETTDEWHDTPDDTEARSYVVEFDSAPDCTHTEVTQWRVEDGGNGHYYAVFCNEGRITWDDAEEFAEGSGGHLASMNSAGENTFLFQLADDPGFWNMTTFKCLVGPWLGGLQPGGSPEPDGGWSWVTGEPFDYTNWDDGEPDNFDGDDKIIFWGGCGGQGRSPFWIDLVGDGRGEVTAFTVEWDTPPFIMGDADCDGDVDNDDMLLILGSAAELEGVETCHSIAASIVIQGIAPADTDCDPDVDAFDALHVLLYLGDLPEPAKPEFCPLVGQALNG